MANRKKRAAPISAAVPAAVRVAAGWANALYPLTVKGNQPGLSRQRTDSIPRQRL